MSPTPEEIRATNLQTARSSGGCGGAASAVVFCFTLGWILWSFLGDLNWGVQGPPGSGWPLARIVGYWVMVGVVTLTGIWIGSKVGPSFLHSNPGNLVIPAGAAIGLTMSFMFWLCAFGTDQWGDNTWSGWSSVIGKAIPATVFGAIISVPWGIATAAIIRSSLRPQKQGQPSTRDFRHPSGGESLEE